MIFKSAVLAIPVLAMALTASAAPVVKLEAKPEARKVMAKDIPVAHTPLVPGGYGRTFPPPVLATCTEPLVSGAPDLRGIWRIVSHNDQPPTAGEHLHNYAERIEQCGDRIVDMGGGTIADGRADGTVENAVRDVSVRDYKTPILVVVTYEKGIYVLRPPARPGFEARRWLDGDGRMHWTRPDYGRAVLERIGGPNDPYTRPE
jgi:hypothetical protein